MTTASAHLTASATNAFNAGISAMEKAVERYLESEAGGLDEARRKFDEEGVVAGALEVVDAMSLGSRVMASLDALGIAPSSPVARELASAALNLATGTPLGPIAAAEDLADAYRAYKAGQKPERAPPEAHAAEPVGARKAKLRSGRAHKPKGYAEPRSSCDARDAASPGFQVCVADIRVLPDSATLKAAGGKHVAALGPNPMFEDLVAAFMMDVIGEQQKEIEAKMAEMQGSKGRQATAKMWSEGLGLLLGASGFAQGVASMFGTPVAGTLVQGATLPISGLKGRADGAVDDEKESRQMLFEQLKNLMNQLQQMQQALSNVLNAMHQGSMNSIRNIK